MSYVFITLLANHQQMSITFSQCSPIFEKRIIWSALTLFEALKLGINGNMFDSVPSFHTNCSLHVRALSTLSMVKHPANRIHEWSILKPILFSIVINYFPDGI